MISFVPIDEAFGLEAYEGISNLAGAVRDLRAEASTLVPGLAGSTVWMVNSTAQGGGVAEMLPKMIRLFNDLGVKSRWVTIGTERQAFFALTKKLHNLIHGEGEPHLTGEEREVYEAVNHENVEEFAKHVGPRDIVVVHDPQPMYLGWWLKRELGLRTVWRCHIGLDEHTPNTRVAWNFLRPYAEGYDHAVFSTPEYIPDYLAGRATIIHPALDPESHKNRELSPHKLTGILCNSGLVPQLHPILTGKFEHRVERLQPDGSFAPAVNGEEIGMLYRPVVTQISRWDRLKGFPFLLDGFIKLKRRREENGNGWDERQRRRIEILRLILAGPDPASVSDDPEGQEVLAELCAKYRELPERYQHDVVLLSLPMDSRKENALMVNALQRCSTVVVQNSVREGFGLTATEAMWKRVPIIGTRACGLRAQIREHIDGFLVHDPSSPDEIANKLDSLLGNVPMRAKLALTAQRRVQNEFLVFKQVGEWLRLLAGLPAPETAA